MRPDEINMYYAMGDSVMKNIRTVSVPWCAYSTVIQLRSWLPDEVGGVAWMALDNPGESPRFPIFCGTTELPKLLQVCGQHSDRDDYGKADGRKADFSMRIFNADGSEGLMCGNGARCVGWLLYEQALTDLTEIRLDTKAGIRTITLNLAENGNSTNRKQIASVVVDMMEPSFREQTRFAKREKTAPRAASLCFHKRPPVRDCQYQ